MDFSYKTAIDHLYSEIPITIIQKENMSEELINNLRTFNFKLSVLLDFPTRPFTFETLSKKEVSGMLEWTVISTASIKMDLSLMASHNLISLLLSKNTGIFVLKGESIPYTLYLTNAINDRNTSSVLSIIKNKGGEIETRLVAHAIVMCARIGKRNQILDAIYELSKIEGGEYQDTISEFVRVVKNLS